MWDCQSVEAYCGNFFYPVMSNSLQNVSRHHKQDLSCQNLCLDLVSVWLTVLSQVIVSRTFPIDIAVISVWLTRDVAGNGKGLNKITWRILGKFCIAQDFLVFILMSIFSTSSFVISVLHKLCGIFARLCVVIIHLIILYTAPGGFQETARDFGCHEVDQAVPICSVCQPSWRCPCGQLPMGWQPSEP